MNELPKFLYEKLFNQYGEEITNKIIDGYKVNRYMTLRVNTLKTDIETIKNTLNEEGFIFEEVSWYKDALIIKNKTEKDIKDLSIYENGEIYLQSLSSMLPVIILDPKENESVLDMAAAPGSKTTQIASITNNNCLITACEKNKIRFERLKFNTLKQGVKRITVLNEDASNLDELFSFDKILLDSPCTGSGTINLNNQIKFTQDYLQKLVNLQTILLKKAIKLLKPGHEMVYSTCSILNDENENVLLKVLGKDVEIVPIDENEFNGLPLLKTSIEGTICIAPNELYEGFFVSKLRKK